MLQKRLERVETFNKLRFRQNIGVVVKQRHVEMRSDRGQYPRGAGTATHVQKQALSAPCLPDSFYPFVHCFHGVMITLRERFYNTAALFILHFLRRGIEGARALWYTYRAKRGLYERYYP